MNNCVIDWLTPWPEEALLSVCTVFLAETDIQEEYRNLILEHIVIVHMSVCTISVKFTAETRRTNYVTPKNFLDYIMTYRTLLKNKRINNSDQAKRLDGGLQKLIQAKVEVSALQVPQCFFVNVIQVLSKLLNSLHVKISEFEFHRSIQWDVWLGVCFFAHNTFHVQ